MSSSMNSAEKQRILRSTIAGIALASSAVLCSTTSSAADQAPRSPKKWEQCLGIARAGGNDCSSTDGRHGCAGASKIDNDPTEYIWVPVGTCERITGGAVHVTVRARKKRNTQCTKTSQRR